jgi:hypothetical protein
MNIDDPVPLFPFTSAQSLAVLILLNPVVNAMLSHYVQSAGGVQIKPTGATEESAIPTAATVGSFLNYPGYLLGSNDNPLAPHALGVYADRIDLAISATPQPLAAVPGSPRPEPVETTPSRIFRQEEAKIATALSNAERAQNSVPLDIPGPQLFKAQRQGRVYVVTFGGVVVSLASSKRTARSLARQFNAAFKHLQRSAFVDIENLASQVSAYLAAASNPTGGFSPVMETVLPTGT